MENRFDSLPYHITKHVTYHLKPGRKSSHTLLVPLSVSRGMCVCGGLISKVECARARDESDTRKQDHCAVICDMPALIRSAATTWSARARRPMPLHVQGHRLQVTQYNVLKHIVVNYLSELSTSDIKAEGSCGLRLLGRPRPRSPNFT